MQPQYDISPEGLSRSLYALASLIEFWMAVEGESRVLTAEEIAEALSPFEVEPGSPEYQALEGLPQPVRRTLAESFLVATKELQPILSGSEGTAGDIPGAVKQAQGKIRGGLRIVDKLAGGLPGWIGEIWEIHVGS